MKARVFKSETKEDDHIHIVSKENFEFVNPWDEYKRDTINVSMYFDNLILKNELPEASRHSVMKVLNDRPNAAWRKKEKELQETKIPEPLLSLLETTKKNDQQKLLRDLTIRSSELNSFITYAFDKYGYLYSMYTRQFEYNGLEGKEMPTALLKNGKVERYGRSNLTDGQLQQTIEHQKVHVARFLDIDGFFHCFFYSFRSLKGKELSFREDRPHLHYISSAWGMKRERVQNELMSRKYKLGSTPHIDFIRDIKL